MDYSQKCRKKETWDFCSITFILHKGSWWPNWIEKAFANETLVIEKGGDILLVRNSFSRSYREFMSGYIIRGANGETYGVSEEEFKRDYEIID